MTVGEVVKLYKNRVLDFEVYKPKDKLEKMEFSTNNCEFVMFPDKDAEVMFYKLLGEKEYNECLIESEALKIDFEWNYENAKGKILCVMMENDGK